MTYLKYTEPFIYAVQKLDDTMQTVTSEHATSREETVIILKLRKLRNIFDRIVGKLEKIKQASYEEHEHLAHLLEQSLDEVHELLLRLKKLKGDLSNPMLLIQHTLIQTLKPQTALLSEL